MEYIFNYLTKNGVQIIIPSKNNHACFYENSEDGRAEFDREVEDEEIRTQVMDVWGDKPTVFPQPLPEPDIEQLKEQKLAENSQLCNYIIENEFKSAIKGDGLQPYRMNRDDQTNISGYIGMINTALIMGTKPEEMPLFSWQNANQTKCVDDWIFTQILGLFQEFGSWKKLVLKRQDDIKNSIVNAETVEKFNEVKIDYSDLLLFGGGSA